jgi:hypothetical protein
MLKQRLTLFLALTGSLLTIIIGMLNDVRLLTIAYRALVSLFIFALIGYVLGLAAEMFLQRLSATIKPKGQKIDITSEEEVIATDYLTAPDDTETEFRPLTPDHFDRISS